MSHRLKRERSLCAMRAVFVYSNVRWYPMSFERSMLAFELSAIIPSNSLRSHAVCSTFDDSPYKLFHFESTVALSERSHFTE